MSASRITLFVGTLDRFNNGKREEHDQVALGHPLPDGRSIPRKWKHHSHRGNGRGVIVDGPGFRYAPFVQGCPHGVPAATIRRRTTLTDRTSRSTRCWDMCKNPFVKGVTFRAASRSARSRCTVWRSSEEQGKHLMATGLPFEELMSSTPMLKVARRVDLLVDGRFLMEQKNIDLRFRGSANQRVLEPKSLEAGAPVWAEQYR
ncbi:MAG: 4Fe-4S cluster-binding domain-containing protein [Butyricicoccus sp.]